MEFILFISLVIGMTLGAMMRYFQNKEDDLGFRFIMVISIITIIGVYNYFDNVELNETEPKQIEVGEIRTFKELGEALKKAPEQLLKDRETIQVEKQVENFSENWAKELSDMVDEASGQELETNSEEQSNQLEAEDTSITETYVYSEEFEKVIEVISEEKVSEYSDEEKYELLFSIVTTESFNKMKEEEKQWIAGHYDSMRHLEAMKYQSINLEKIGDWFWDSFKELMRILIGFGAAFFFIRITLDSRKSGSELLKERLGIEEPTEHKEPEIVLSPLEQKIQDRNEMLIED